jgi:cytochrome c oxidase subunit 2
MALPGCAGSQSALDAHGAPAIHLVQLIAFIVVVCAAIWLLVVAVLVRAVWRSHDMSQQPPVLEPGPERRLALAVAACTAATVLIISVFTAASFFTTRALTFAGDGDLTIRVRGQQWWWDIGYIDPQSRFSTANEIHIPVGRNVRVQLEGADVIHSFWVPSLAGKQDIIPGRLNELTIRAERAGIYRGQCAEFCGMQHAHMALLVVAEDEAAFEAWRAREGQNALAPAQAETQAGQQLFLSRQCGACHAVRGTAAAGMNGPDLTHVGGRRFIAAGLLETTRGSIAAWIADPQTLKPGNNMPMVQLSPGELRAVSAYMASLK